MVAPSSAWGCASTCSGQSLCCWQRFAFWACFVFPVYKSLGFLGKCARERGFVPCMAGLCVPGLVIFCVQVHRKGDALKSVALGVLSCSFPDWA